MRLVTISIFVAMHGRQNCTTSDHGIRDPWPGVLKRLEAAFLTVSYGELSKDRRCLSSKAFQRSASRVLVGLLADTWIVSVPRKTSYLRAYNILTHVVMIFIVPPLSVSILGRRLDQQACSDAYTPKAIFKL